jgi:hypothetical protein
VAIVGKKLEHEIEQLHRFHFRFGHLFACLRSGLQTHGSTGRPSPHSARVPARFSGRGAPQSPGGTGRWYGAAGEEMAPSSLANN